MKTLFGIVGLAFILAGTGLELAILHRAAGFLGIVLGVVLLPVAVFGAPIYALVAWGAWKLVLLTWGAGVLGTLFVALALRD